MALSEKQRVFCEHYAACHNAAEAARRAGYSEKTARAQGYDLLTRPHIKAYIDEITKDAREKAQKERSDRIATLEEVLEYLSKTMRNELERTSERTRAAQILKEALAEREPEGKDETVTEIVVVAEDAGGEDEAGD